MATNYYSVVIQTGNKGGAGTDANVLVHLYGDAGRLEGQELDNPGDDRERGDKDRYLVSSEEGSLGKICAVKIEHDDDGGGSGWYIDYVTVEDFGPNTYGPPIATRTFRVDRWLATDEDDKKTYVTIGTPPSVGLIQSAMAYEGVRVGISHAALHTPSTTGDYTQVLTATSVLTISEETTESEANRSETVIAADTSYSWGPVAASLSVTNTTSKEIVKSATKAYSSADSVSSISTTRYNFVPEEGKVIGVVYYEYKTIANGIIGIADRRFDFSHASTRWLVPVTQVFDEGSSELKEFEKGYERYLNQDDPRSKVDVGV